MKIETLIYWNLFQRKLSRAMGFENITHARVMAAIFNNPGCTIMDLYIFLNVSSKDNRMQNSIDLIVKTFRENGWIAMKNQGRYYMTVRGMQEKMPQILEVLNNFHKFVENSEKE